MNRKLHLVLPNMQPDFENLPLLSFLEVYAAYFPMSKPYKTYTKNSCLDLNNSDTSQKCVFSYEVYTNRLRSLLVKLSSLIL